jgi:putative DNA primase/helicase
MFLVIPYFAPDGTPLAYARLKPDKPKANRGKYEAPRRQGNQAYFPPRTRPAVADPAIPLLVTEGEKKAAKADQEGFPCVGLAGVWNWTGGNNKDDPEAVKNLIPSMAGVAWQGRPVFIAFDCDPESKPDTRRNVAYAEWHLAETLTARGAVVKMVRLPPGPNGAKCGLDDFLVAHNAEALRQLIDEAVPPQRPPGARTGGLDDDALPPDEADDDPHRLARVHRGRCRVAERVDGKAGWRDALFYWREEFMRWKDGAYRPLQDKEVKAELTATIKREFDHLWRVHERERREKKNSTPDPEGKSEPDPKVQKVTAAVTRDALQALASMSLIQSAIEQPAWLGDAVPPWSADEVLPARNGLIHLPSLVAGKPDCFAPPTPRLFTRNTLDYDVALDDPAPSAWLDFLRQLWPNDAEAVAALQEWFGYCLLPDTSQQKILAIVGPRRSGKGTIARVLGRLVGMANVCAPTLSSLGGNFGLWPLLGKTVAIVSDARLSRRADTMAVIVERLLSISGEDAQTIDRKNLSQVTCKVPVRFTILTNELPELDDPSGALVGRMIVLRQTRTWYGKEDVGLTGRLLQELPGVLLWAIQGWQRLRERGHFKQPASASQLIEDLEDLAGPIGAFIREKCEVGADFEVAVKDLFAAWKLWCEAKGRRPGKEHVFGRDLRAALPELENSRPRTDDGGRERHYAGIRLACRPPAF